MFDIFYKPFAWMLLELYKLCGNFGAAIILFAIAANIIMLPLHIKGKKSMMRTTRLQPKLRALQKQYANDQKKQQELMQKLYQEEGINPMGGCGWSLLPFPIFLILYAVLREPLTHLMGLSADQITQVADVLNFTMSNTNGYQQITMAQMIHENFATISQQVPGLVDINFMFFGINLSQIPNWKVWEGLSWSIIIPILSGLAAWGQQIVMQKTMPTSDESSNAANSGMMKIMPLMSVWFAFIMPASMGVYWIIGSIISAAREFVLNKYYKKKFDEEDALKEAAAAKRREAEKAERAERVAQQQAIAAQQRAAAGRPKSKKKKPSQKKAAAAADDTAESSDAQPSSDQDWQF